MEVREERLAHLERLAEKLTTSGFTAELASQISTPCLTVANARQPTLNERVLCERADNGSWSYWWPWQQPIGSVEDLELVIDRIAIVLRSVEGDR